MQQSLIATHGKEVAGTIMSHSPPTGWADVARLATSKDIDAVRAEMKILIESAIHQQTKWMIGAITGINTLLFAAFFAAMSFFN